jgi:hypothetical protein
VFTLQIELGNDAMSTANDVANALYALAGRMAGDDSSLSGAGSVRDDNGNTVGRWSIDTDEA